MIISSAYDVLPFYVLAPDWMSGGSAPRFDIEAKADVAVSDGEVKKMLRTLLKERLRLKLHHELVDGVHQALRVGKGGHKLKDAAPQGKDPVPVVRFDRRNFRDVFRGASMETLIFHLNNFGTKVVYDQTGLKGKYDFDLEYGRYLEGDPTPSAVATAREEALRADLGLVIVDARFPVDMLVVDSAERVPIEN